MYLNFYVIIATKVLLRTLDRQNVALTFIVVIIYSEENISQGVDLYGNILFLCNIYLYIYFISKQLYRSDELSNIIKR